eukprot:CAMPEP_0119217642 /NCGR_PEP_ID=MMETSP1327-20130426/18674_1 /TAXON_ID=38833 /ORGANISM="Micromonas pusilla, Strain RCC2306" /LENGTH=100 /DNA_ID=CAMNT_0007215629 /DNA_START=389 /DNA_END=688 /DNA_ORIENTATION=-
MPNPGVSGPACDALAASESAVGVRNENARTLSSKRGDGDGDADGDAVSVPGTLAGCQSALARTSNARVVLSRITAAYSEPSEVSPRRQAGVSSSPKVSPS